MAEDTEESMNILNRKGTLIFLLLALVVVISILSLSQRKAYEERANRRQEQITEFRRDFVKELAENIEEGRVPLTPEQKVPEPTSENPEPKLSPYEQREALEKLLREKGIHIGIILSDPVPNFEHVVHCNDTISRMEQLADLYEEAGRTRDARNWRIVLAYFYEQGWDYCERDRNYSKINSLAQARKYYEAAGWTYAARRVNDKIEEIAKKYEE